jgi:hypothetical protein
MTQIEKRQVAGQSPRGQGGGGPRRFLSAHRSGKWCTCFTNTVFTTDPKKVDLDGFVQAQLDAGKLVIAED